MSRRTKNSLPSRSEADVQRFVLELPATDEDQDTTKKEDFKVEKTEPENKIGKLKQENICTSDVANVSDVATEDHTKAKHSTCDECKSNQREITEIKAMIREIQTNQIKDHENAILKEIESVATIKSLREENNEMPSEIAHLRSTISELITDNESMRKIFDFKQNEWVKVEGKPSKPKIITPKTTSTTTSTVNRFETLIDENSEHLPTVQS